jgi:hypothetical protein
MTFLSCLAIGVAFLLAVGLLLFVAVMLGWYLPEMIDRARSKDPFAHLGPPPEGGTTGNGGGTDAIDPPGSAGT